MLFFTETWTAQFSRLSNSDSKLNTRFKRPVPSRRHKAQRAWGEKRLATEERFWKQERKD